jgi:hypothetical protein
MNIIIPFSKFHIIIEPEERMMLPPYKGSTFRGGFGNAFRSVVCISRKTECSSCIVKDKCIYSYIFETPPPSHTEIMRKYEKAPHPFIIEPPLEKKQVYDAGDEIIFNLILIGQATEYLPYFIYSFEEMGKKGIGKGRGRFKLKKVIAGDSSQLKHDNLVYSSETKVLHHFEISNICLSDEEIKLQTDKSFYLSLEFLTPTRIVYHGKLISQLEFHIFMRALLRRIALLSYFHCNNDPSLIPFKGLIEQADEVTAKKSNLQWYDWERYSSRQDTKMKLGGSVGTIEFEGNLSGFLPYIKAGEILHVGKGTSFGLEKYAVKN